MKSSAFGANRLAIDPAAAADLRTRLRQDPQAGTREAAQQFEGMLVHLMLKSMRDATASDGMLDSDQSRFFTAIGDQQLAQNLAAQAPLGLAALIEKQAAQSAGSGVESLPLDALQRSSQYLAERLTRATPAGVQAALPAAAAVARSSTTSATSAASTTSGTSVTRATSASSATSSSTSARDFVGRVWSHAAAAAATTGVPPHFLVAHAALESGWGKREIKTSDGSPSFNLFGVKAGRNWSGATTEVVTTEFVNGAAQTTRAKFRVYPSYAEAFRDYAELLASKPRFAGVLGQQDGKQFARSLQQAGYATDPMYADKLARIIGGPTLRQALSA